MIINVRLRTVSPLRRMQARYSLDMVNSAYHSQEAARERKEDPGESGVSDYLGPLELSHSGN